MADPGTTPTAGWLDLTAGASGDMLLGALVDLGVPLAVVADAVTAVCGDAVTLTPEPTRRHGLGGTLVRVTTPVRSTPRTWRDVRALLQQAPLLPAVGSAALAVFALLARAEAAVHRIEPDEVHFHEVGAWDALADVVGVVAGIDHLGVTRWTASTVSVGAGSVRGEHGVIPIPAPAVLELLRDVPVVAGPVPHESCTPTGAALLRHLVDDWGPMPALRVSGIGHGAGGRDPAEHPNLLRMIVGEPADGQQDEITTSQLVVEANVDDLDPRAWPHVLAALLSAGAADAWLTPILMKKGRPAQTLSVLCADRDLATIREVVFRQTSTIGLRIGRVDRVALPRTTTSVAVYGQVVAVKLAGRGDDIVNVSVEHDDVSRAADATGRPFRDVLAAAQAAAHTAAHTAAEGAPKP